MVVKKLILKNFRGFENIELAFHDSLNIFIGRNGSGKTTVLDAIAFNLEHLTKRLNASDDQKKFPKEYWPIPEDLKKGQKNGTIRVILEDNKIKYEQVFEIKDDGSHSYNKYSYKGKIKRIDEYISKSRLNTVFPILLHIKSNRNKIDKLDKKVMYINRLECYENAFSFGNVHFSDFAQWFEKHENNENAQKAALKDLSYKTPSLECIRSAIISFFTTLENIDLHSLSINRTQELSNQFISEDKTPQLKMWKGNNDFNFNQLSDGEQSLVIIVADIARRAYLAAPSLGLQAFGIVLIDEIELHLHPSWQRKILPALAKTFPNVQFITATHSPQVLSSVKTESITFLKDFKQNDIHSPYGKDTNSILELMEVQEGPFSEKISSLYKLIMDKEIKGAKKLQKDLEAEIEPDYGPLVKSRMFIERLENQ